MNRSYTVRLAVAVLVVAVLLIAVIGLPSGISSSAGQATVTRLPRPHPRSHIKIDQTDSLPRSPRPHPQSHIRSTATPIDQP